MVKNLREKRASSGGGAGTISIDRPRRKSIVDAENAKTNRRLSGRRIQVTSPDDDTDQAEDKVSADESEESEGEDSKGMLNSKQG
jgi:hypothetical protein